MLFVNNPITWKLLHRFESNFIKNIFNSLNKIFREITIEKVSWEIEKFEKNLKL